MAHLIDAEVRGYRKDQLHKHMQLEVVEWLVNPGDTVQKGQDVVTARVVRVPRFARKGLYDLLKFSAPYKGVVVSIVPVGQIVAYETDLELFTIEQTRTPKEQAYHDAGTYIGRKIGRGLIRITGGTPVDDEPETS